MGNQKVVSGPHTALLNELKEYRGAIRDIVNRSGLNWSTVHRHLRGEVKDNTRVLDIALTVLEERKHAAQGTAERLALATGAA